MASHPSRRLDRLTLQADLNTMTALEQIGDYAPANVAYNKETLFAKRAAMEAARTAEFNAQNALNAARDAATAAEWSFHEAMLGTKEQVIAQYGSDSDEVQAIGLKKKSDRKRVLNRQRKQLVEQ